MGIENDNGNKFSMDKVKLFLLAGLFIATIIGFYYLAKGGGMNGYS